MSQHKNNFAGRNAAGQKSAKVFKTSTRDASDERGSFPQSLVARALAADTSSARVSNSFSRSKLIAMQRRETLRRWSALKKSRTAAKAARMVGVSIPTLWRWQNKLAAQGQPGLQPANFKSGRRSPFKKIRLSAQGVRALELLIVELSSPRAAWQKFAGSPLCPPSIARHVQRSGNAPAAFAGLGRVSQVQARCYVSADRRRLFVKLPCKNTPPKFRLSRINLP